MHLLRVGNQSCESQGTTNDIGDDDAPHLAKQHTLIREPQDAQWRKHTNQYDDDVHDNTPKCAAIELFIIPIHETILLMEATKGTVFLHASNDGIDKRKKIVLTLTHQHANLTMSEGFGE